MSTLCTQVEPRAIMLQYSVKPVLVSDNLGRLRKQGRLYAITDKASLLDSVTCRWQPDATQLHSEVSSCYLANWGSSCALFFYKLLPLLLQLNGKLNTQPPNSYCWAARWLSLTRGFFDYNFMRIYMYRPRPTCFLFLRSQAVLDTPLHLSC